MFTHKIHNGKVQVEERFTPNLPEWMSFAMRIASSASVAHLLWSLAYLTLFLLVAPSLWWLLLLPVVIYHMGAFHGAIINWWYAHKYGYRNFKLKNTSQNLLMVDAIYVGRFLSQQSSQESQF